MWSTTAWESVFLCISGKKVFSVRGASTAASLKGNVIQTAERKKVLEGSFSIQVPQTLHSAQCQNNLLKGVWWIWKLLYDAPMWPSWSTWLDLSSSDSRLRLNCLTTPTLPPGKKKVGAVDKKNLPGHQSISPTPKHTHTHTYIHTQTLTKSPPSGPTKWLAAD